MKRALSRVSPVKLVVQIDFGAVADFFVVYGYAVRLAARGEKQNRSKIEKGFFHRKSLIFKYLG